MARECRALADRVEIPPARRRLLAAAVTFDRLASESPATIDDLSWAAEPDIATPWMLHFKKAPST